jgi:Flp pilus assembly protein TadB
MTLASVILGGLLIAAGISIALSATGPAVAPLSRTVAYLHRRPLAAGRTDGPWDVVGRHLVKLAGSRMTGDQLTRRLRLVGRPAEVHATYLVAGGVTGFLLPVAVATLASLLGGFAIPWLASGIAAILGAALGVFVVQTDLTQRADAALRDLRHQLSAYLDVLTMLLAANQGNEGALKLAADAGDGRLFVELRRRITESSTSGRPTVTALAALGRDLGVVELVEIAASASLATSHGAPVSRSLTAKTQSLRAALQAEQEQDARIRTGKITFPLVGMGLVFMVLGLYPALASIQGS